ncbi:MAG: formyltransferase family protein [Pseudomonadota bacterium]|nr:formyltransferase family protein [Pseudomonadota bacterium]
MNVGKIVVAISGKGVMLQHLLLHQQEYHYQVVGVIASKDTAAGLVYARKLDLPTLVCDFDAQEQATRKLTPWLQHHAAEAIILAGFTRRFPAVAGFEHHTISTHPSLLPKFGGEGMFGMNVHRAVFDAGETTTGITAHMVVHGFDEGHYVAQVATDISKCRNAKEVQSKVLAVEKHFYPHLIRTLVAKHWDDDWSKIPTLKYRDADFLAATGRKQCS